MRTNFIFWTKDPAREERIEDLVLVVRIEVVSDTANIPTLDVEIFKVLVLWLPIILSLIVETIGFIKGIVLFPLVTIANLSLT